MRLADFIDQDLEPILLQWESFARSLWRGTAPDPATLRDHAKDILCATVHDMRSGQTLLQQSEKSKGRIDVHDHCGGLPAGALEHMFQPFAQTSEDRSGLGLGLDICRRSVEANGGVLSVIDRPGAGCTFTIDLERA